MIRGENVYTVRFPFEMRLYVKDSFSSFFVECCALNHSGPQRKKSLFQVVKLGSFSFLKFLQLARPFKNLRTQSNFNDRHYSKVELSAYKKSLPPCTAGYETWIINHPLFFKGATLIENKNRRKRDFRLMFVFMYLPALNKSDII